MLNVVVILVAVCLPASLWLLIRSPFNIAAIVGALTWLFTILPAIYFINNRVILSYSWRNFSYVGGPLSYGNYLQETLLLLTLMAAAITVGSVAAVIFETPPEPLRIGSRKTSSLATVIMIAVWAASALYFFKLSNWDVGTFLLPVRESYREPGYPMTVFIGMPIAIVAKSFWDKGRLDLWTLTWIAISLMAAFSRSQRRDLVTVVLFLGALLVLVRPLVARSTTIGLRTSRTLKASGVMKALFFGLLGTSLALVPLLWYSRVYFNNRSMGKLIDPTQIRGVDQLLLGSPATGFPTFALIRDYVSEQGAQVLYLPEFLLSLPIPRALYPGKPSAIDGILEDKYQLIENPSAFWFGELYLTAAIFAIPLSLALGFVLYKVANRACSSPLILVRTLAAVSFMQSVTLFKNGLGQFAINGVTVALLLLFAWYFPASERKLGQGSRQGGRKLLTHVPARRLVSQEMRPGGGKLLTQKPLRQFADQESRGRGRKLLTKVES